jgi:hypothetical protein
MNHFKLFSAVILTAGVLLLGCGQKPAANAQQAIEDSKSKGSVQQQVDYLVGQAKAFLSKDNYTDAMTVANHVLANVDQNSKAAQEVLIKARDEMQKKGQDTVNDLKNKFGVTGK